MLTFLRSVFIVARNELKDAVRSRRVAILLILYLAGAMLASNGIISMLHRVEIELTKALAVTPSATTGVVTDILWKSDAFRNTIIHLVGDKKTAMELLSIPPVALIYAWLAFTFTPFFIIISSSGRIAEEVRHGSVRFVLTRTSRYAWCLGKFMGQAMEIVIPLILSAIGVWCIARFRLTHINNAALISATMIYAWKVWVYLLAFIGLALGISQITRSVNIAISISFIIWIAMVILHAFAKRYAGPGIQQLWQLVEMITPTGHKLNLWRTDMAHVLQACTYLVTLAFTYLFFGFIVFNKRDL
ncbi:ABC transporter permease [Verrucomicrobiota bacterium]